jgi:anti-sigma regulatory factor (Ser/Thr protein kinase)
LVLTVGDVTGKGLAASLVMGKVRQMLRVAALVDSDPANLLNLVDRALTNEHPEMLVTAFVAVLERETGMLSWASAGHPPSFVRTADGHIMALESISLPLGLRDDDPPTERIQLGPGAMIVAYTDGLVEAERAILDGIARVSAALSDPKVYASDNPATALYETVVLGNARDDVAVVTLVYTGMPGVLTPAPPERLAWQCWSDDVTSVSQARSELRERLAERGISGAELFTIELAYGELISNVVRYAPGPCESILELSENEIALTVLDQGAGFEFTAVELVDPFAEHGRGLYLVAALGQSFAVARSPQNGASACVTFARAEKPASLAKRS